MSIAELIMQGTKRSSESTAWVGDSLAKLGQQVGASLAEREQQKQAQEMLPFLQQSMQDSMRLAGEGKSGEAYSMLMPFLTDPSVARNPFMMPALEAGIKMNQVAADDYMRSEQLRIQEGMYNQRSEYNTSLIGLRQSQAETKAEVDNRRLDISEERNNLIKERQEVQDDNEKARIDVQLQRLDLDEQKLDSINFFQQQKLDASQDTSYQQRYQSAAGYGGARNVGTQITPTDRAEIEQAAKDVTNDVLLPDEVPKKNPSGIPAMETKPFTMESDAATFAQLAEQPYQPSEEVVQEFKKNFNQYQSASPKEKKKIESKNTIVYDSMDEFEKDKPNLTTQFDAFTDLDAGAVDSTLVGAKYLRDVEKGKNAQGQISEYEPNVGAVKSIQELQIAFNLVNGRRDLSELYTKAGGWKGVELKGTPEEKKTSYELSGTPAKYEVINKKTNEAIKVSKEDYDKLQTIQARFATSDTMKMELILVKGKEPAPQATAQSAKTNFEEGKIYKQGGIKYKYTNGQFIPVQ